MFRAQAIRKVGHRFELFCDRYLVSPTNTFWLFQRQSRARISSGDLSQWGEGAADGYRRIFSPECRCLPGSCCRVVSRRSFVRRCCSCSRNDALCIRFAPLYRSCKLVRSASQHLPLGERLEGLSSVSKLPHRKTALPGDSPPEGGETVLVAAHPPAAP